MLEDRNTRITGVWTAIATPFKEENGRSVVDLDAYKLLLRLQVEAGVSGVIPCGTTGESPTLSLNEKKLLVETTLQELKDEKVGVAVGTGTNCTRSSVEFSQWASDHGVDAILVVCPYYNKPTQRGMAGHFKAIADAVKCQVILYNVPGRTGVSLDADTVAELASVENITAIKEASGDMRLTDEILEACQRKNVSINILSGDDPSYLKHLQTGAVGVISVASNIIPKTVGQIYKHHLDGDLNSAQALNEKYMPLFKALFIEPNPAPIKETLAYAGLCKNLVRLPLTTMEEENTRSLHSLLEDLSISPASTGENS